MAERRMFAKTIVLSDAFLDMPLSTRCLYFTLGMFADDEGFVNNPKSIMRQCGATVDDMNILLAKKFVLAFESGVIVIKHWKIHNYIQSDRFHPTKYQSEKELLAYDENGAYTLSSQTLINTEMYTECIQPVSEMDTEVRLGKESIGKESIGKDNTTPLPPSKGKQETQEELFNRLSEGKQLSDPLKEKLHEWIQYKKELKQSYKEMGMKSFITQMERYEQEYGTSDLINCITLSMARGYRGIITNLIDKGKPQRSVMDDWKDVIV
jgi:hypothetical protein